MPTACCALDVNGQVVVLAGGHRVSSLVANKGPRGSCLLAGGAVGQSVAVAGGGDDVGVVAEPVEQRHCGWLVGQEPAPVVELVAVCGYSFQHHDRFYIPGLLVEYGSRTGKGFGATILGHTLDDLRSERTGNVFWLVHPENEPMQALLSKIGATMTNTTPI